MRSSWFVGFLPMLIWLMPAGSSGDELLRIRHAGYSDFGKGTLGSGANLYVSRHGRVQVIHKWDLNKDGFIDILISNDHDTSSAVDGLIYWGSEQGPRSLLPELWSKRPLSQRLFGVAGESRTATRLPSSGGRSLIADLNRDGFGPLRSLRAAGFVFSSEAPKDAKT